MPRRWKQFTGLRLQSLFYTWLQRNFLKALIVSLPSWKSFNDFQPPEEFAGHWSLDLPFWFYLLPPPLHVPILWLNGTISHFWQLTNALLSRMFLLFLPPPPSPTLPIEIPFILKGPANTTSSKKPSSASSTAIPLPATNTYSFPTQCPTAHFIWFKILKKKKKSCHHGYQSTISFPGVQLFEGKDYVLFFIVPGAPRTWGFVWWTEGLHEWSIYWFEIVPCLLARGGRGGTYVHSSSQDAKVTSLHGPHEKRLEEIHSINETVSIHLS